MHRGTEIIYEFALVTPPLVHGTQAGRPPLPRAALTLALWIGLTGALHEDGLMDVADAAFSAGRFLDLHAALDRLAAVDRRKMEVIELRYFGGLTLDETAEHLGISPATAHREQRFAKWASIGRHET